MGKLSAQIARSISEQIAKAGWPVGEIIATEAELIRNFSVSRAVLREALGLIELHGIGTMKAGKGGGLLVTAPAYEANVGELAAFLEVSDVRIHDLIEVWQLLEAKAVELAILHLDEEGTDQIAAFRENFAAPFGDVVEESTKFRQFWALIAKLSRNPILMTLIDAFQLSLSGLSVARLHQPENLAHHLHQSRGTKRAIIDGILSCDSFTALTALRQDFLNQYRAVERSQIATMSRIATDDARGDRKLPRWIAFKISRQIAELGLQPGDSMGSESALLLQFGVSRSVLREAIRMLEAHSVVETRRGKGGGLRVALPDPGPASAAAVRFLMTLPITREHVFEIRYALEIRAAGMAAKNEAHIQAAHETHNSAALFQAIIESSGNNVMIFVSGIIHQILSELDAQPTSDYLQDYEKIIGSICEGDAAGARRQMKFHLDRSSRHL
ncbi:FadR/GntR family transcriptional regulator [Sphingobium sp. EM0848]|uniref:FadR/GntR family transcriptional regulator n=1 Tax=Sphingobium sp. EM0848 TaxID=2743473 RepID=UPI00159BFB13|nr:GntR family transcriptional regulator [Sphingobium sp. EM0848]